ncbi:helix-turn-helix domain-containing protein [Desertibacillus haloalkaliphilus]|uniref:helix-turn-helix domain-containing protein n=1 Tax=Desertibacillus haloalkaliphilus TaxID=1328930 RepID=UPI001C26B98F|nr:helix-turn-helix transcriptional regulator [Desertibacillus haloalkaliphilus]MBU8908250.1 helix-turn-helix domain-containing protein [Desertibacillus haloalkaliphilus]
MFGLGKPRSKFGKFLDKHSISQVEMAKESGVNKNTLSRIAKSNENRPSMKNGSKIIKALKKNGYDVDFDDFWDA